MKHIKVAITILLTTFFSSCLDTEEKIVLNADNSGTYSMTYDLGRLLKLAGSMGALKPNTDKSTEKKDTTIYFRDLLDAAENLSAAEKALFRDGMIKVKMDEAQNEMKVVMMSPFKNTAALTEIKNNFTSVMEKLKAFEKAAGNEQKPGGEVDKMKMGSSSANPVGEQFTFLASPGKISSSITNIEAFKTAIAADSSLAMMTQMTSMMGDFNYRTVIVLPKAVKGYDGPGSTISADKKTITFLTTLTEMVEHPEKVSYKVEY